MFKLMLNHILFLFMFLTVGPFYAAQAVIFPIQVQRPPSPEEQRLYVNLKGDDAAGVLLSYRYLLTAQHVCRLDPHATLPASDRKKGEYLHSVRVAEISFEYDYCILEITWSIGFHDLPKQILFPVKIWTSKGELQLGEKLFHLGNPNGKAAYSEGDVKAMNPSMESHLPFLQFDISSIYGSSGGPVFRKSDLMLVSLMSGPVEKDIWTGGDSNNPLHWVQGPALYEVYQKSAILKEIFPDGKNKFAHEDGTPILDAQGSLDKDGNRDITFSKLFEFVFDQPHDLQALFLPWRNKNLEWQLFSPSLAYKTNVCPEGWRLPKIIEVQSETDLKNPNSNSSFGGFLNQFPKAGFWVENESQNVCLQTGKIIHKPEKNNQSFKNGYAPALYKCLPLCVRDI